MQVSPEITLKGVEMTPVIDKMIKRGIAKLEQTCDYIISTRIALEQIQGRHQTGNPYRMHIDISIPNRPEIVVKRMSRDSKKIPDNLAQLEIDTELSDDPETDTAKPVGRNLLPRRVTKEEPLEALIRRSFDSAERELQKMVDKQRGEVKTQTQHLTGIVEKIFRDQDYGFLRDNDSQQEVYFNKNSLLHNHWVNLTVGTIVRYTPEIGEKGIQATTVEPTNKPGVAEQHDELHDLPDMSAPVRTRKKAGRTTR